MYSKEMFDRIKEVKNFGYIYLLTNSWIWSKTDLFKFSFETDPLKRYILSKQRLIVYQNNSQNWPQNYEQNLNPLSESTEEIHLSKKQIM